MKESDPADRMDMIMNLVLKPGQLAKTEGVLTGLLIQQEKHTELLVATCDWYEKNGLCDHYSEGQRQKEI